MRPASRRRFLTQTKPCLVSSGFDKSQGEGQKQLNKNFSVTDAAMEVGYESVSQFIWDDRKMFTALPKEDMQSLHRQFSKGASSSTPNDAL